MEQAIVSAWSLRYYTPNAHIVLVCDQDSRQLLESGWRKEYLALFDDIKVCTYEANQSMMERSRQMKTTLRRIIEGNFLYLDTDTIVCRDLSFVDDIAFELGFVYDNNCTFDKFLIRHGIIANMQKFFGMDVSNEIEFFNGGIFLAKDTELVRGFFDRWHENWLFVKDKFGSMKDQPPLMKTNIELGRVITPMDGCLNCQLVASIAHLHNVAIMHIYNNFNGKDTSVTPFHSLDTYHLIKENGFTDEWKYKVIHIKELFSSPSFVLGEANSMEWRKLHEDGSIRLLHTPVGEVLRKIYWTHPRIFRLIDRMAGCICRFL